MEQLQLSDKPEIKQIVEPFDKVFETRCPYLGLKDDRATALGFPNDSNHCYRHDQAAPMTQEWQAENCLSCNFASCSIFQQETLPEESLNRASIWLSWTRPLAIVLPIALIIIAALVWWPTPGKSIEESTSLAAPLSEETAETPIPAAIKTSAEEQPALMNRLDHVTKTGVESSVTPTIEEPAADVQEEDEGGGGFRVTTYD